MYSKQTWTNGEIITQEKLNHMEEGIATGGGIYTYGELTLFDGEVTTVKDGDFPAYADITLQGDLPKSDISVTFNGQDYTLPYSNDKYGDYWGEEESDGTPVFTNYPVFVYDYGNRGINTPEAGTYSLRIKSNGLELNDIIANLIPETFVITVSVDDDSHNIFDKTYNQIADAFNKKQNIIIDNFGTREYIESIVEGTNPDDISSSVYDVYAIAIDHPNLSFKLRKYSATDADGFPIFIQDI